MVAVGLVLPVMDFVKEWSRGLLEGRRLAGAEG